MMNSRVRSTPDLGRGSSRNFVWKWYQIWGSCRYERSSLASSVKISSWVGDRQRSVPRRSLSLKSSSP